MSEKLTIAVLFGGQSGEHEVSLTSAQAVMNALDPTKYNVIPIGITKAGQWMAGPATMATLVAAADPALLPAGMLADPAEADTQSTATITPDDTATDEEHNSMLASAFRALPTHIDVVFPVLHGPMGEDGTIQGLLELAGLPYVGCGVAASAVAMDKALMKAAFAAANLPILPWLLVRRSTWRHEPQQVASRIEEQLGYPVFVKPANMGSSVGVNKATDRASLEVALNEAARYDRRIVVEQGIPAREIEISVLGNDDPAVSVPGEVIPSGEWYDYEAKYLAGQSRLLIPAPIDADLTEQVRVMARQAFIAIDGAGLARVDFLLNKETNKLWLNEANTMPGFTFISMYAKMWAASGMDYSTLLDRLIALALERHTEANDK